MAYDGVMAKRVQGEKEQADGLSSRGFRGNRPNVRPEMMNMIAPTTKVGRDVQPAPFEINTH